ncbi:MAG: DNA repair protein RecO [Ginsengibacter sp.]
MIYSTKGIVIRTVKYGETSVIAAIFTEMFGIQSYMVNGVRSYGKTSKAHFFQSSSILDMQVYHSELKNLQRIKEVNWSHLYRNILSDVTKNAVALYMVELLQKCLKQPESNPDLFHFCEDAFLQLDISDAEVTANFPLYFCLQLAHFFGFRLQNNYSDERNLFNCREGNFADKILANDYFVEAGISYYISQLLKASQPEDLLKIKLNKSIRRTILSALENYYAFHIPEFGTMKTLPVLHELLG